MAKHALVSGLVWTGLSLGVLAGSSFGCSDSDDDGKSPRIRPATGGDGGSGASASGGAEPASGGTSGNGGSGAEGTLGGAAGSDGGGTGATAAGGTAGAGAAGQAGALGTGGGETGGAGTGGAGTGGAGTGGAGTGGAGTGGAGTGGAGTGGAGTGGAGTSGAGTGGAGTGGEVTQGGASGSGNTAGAGGAGPLVCDAGFGDCDGLPGNGCETTLVDNDAFCGSCERDCTAAGTTCSTDYCTALPLYTGLPFGTDNSGAVTWAFANGVIYETPFYSYVVRKYPVSGTGSGVVWAGDNAVAGTQSLYSDGTYVYWSQQGTPDVVLRKAVGAAADVTPTVVFQPTYAPTFLQVVGGSFYWASGAYQSGDAGGYLYSRPVGATGEAGTQLVSVDQGTHGAIRAFVATSNALYWVTSGGTGTPYALRTTPLAGGTPVEVPGGAVTGYPYDNRVALHADGDVLYFVRNVDASFLNGIYRYQVGDTAPTQLVVAEDVTDFAFDAEYLYFVRANVANVWRAPLAGGAPVAIANVGGARVVGQDATFVYVARSYSSTTDLLAIVK